MDLKIITLAFDIFVLILIIVELFAIRKHRSKIDASTKLLLKEIEELKTHQSSLTEHAALLSKSRPVITSLYTDETEIMDLAIHFLDEATECFYLGSFESLTVENSQEIEMDHSDLKKKEYITKTQDYILSGKKYVRIINFEPSQENNYNSVLAHNIQFFQNLLNFESSRDIKLELYHNNQIPTFSGDFHFRCSNKQLIIRSGGHKNKFTNNAILINDTRVIHEYQQYISSIVESKNSIKIGVNELKQMSENISKNRIDKIRDVLAKAKDQDND
jgi:hypothetical protein